MFDAAAECDGFAVEFSAFDGDAGLYKALCAGADGVAVFQSGAFKRCETVLDGVDGGVEFGSRVCLVRCRVGEDLADLVCGAESGAFLVGGLLCFAVFEGDDLDAVADLGESPVWLVVVFAVFDVGAVVAFFGA